MNQKGFTLIELMVTLTIMAISMAWALPSFYQVVQNNRSSTLATEFIRGMNLAREEAVRRGQIVSMCPSANTSQTACSGGSNWSNGWIVFADANGNGSIDPGEEVIFVGEALSGDRRITTTLSQVSYDGTGFLTSASGSFVIDATGCKGSYARIVSLSTTGRIAVSVGTCS